MRADESFTVIAVTALALFFVMYVLTYTLAEPIDDIYEALLDSDMGEDVNPYKNEYIPYYRTATILAFALIIVGPFGWWFAKVFSKDPYEGYYYEQQRRW